MSSRLDTFRLLVYAYVFSTLVAIITAAVIAWKNARFTNLSLATGTLGAASTAFLIQLFFELRDSKDRDHVSTEFTIDRSVPSIRQWNYTGTPSWRIGVETNASGWLVANNLLAFSNDLELLTSDFAMFSLLCFLTAQEFDWQLRKITYRSKGFGTSTLVSPISKDEECSSLDEGTLRAALIKSGNLFAGAPLLLVSGKLRLPPESTIEITRKSIVIRNPVCQVTWHREDESTVLSHMQPGTGGESPQLPSGAPKFETRMSGFNVEVLYYRWRSQRVDIGKYRDWVSRVLADVHEWFESDQRAA